MWKQLKTHKKYSGDYRAGSNRAAVGFTYPVISGSSVIKAPDRLTALGNANTDRKKYLIYFGNNPDTGNGNVSTVNRICSVVTKDIVHGDLYNGNGDLIHAGSHSKGCDHFQIFHTGTEHMGGQAHFSELCKINNHKNTGNCLSDHSSPGAAFDPPSEYKNKKRVKNGIDNCSGEHTYHGIGWTSVRADQMISACSQYKKWKTDSCNAQIILRIRHNLRRSAEQMQKRI